MAKAPETARDGVSDRVDVVRDVACIVAGRGVGGVEAASPAYLAAFAGAPRSRGCGDTAPSFSVIGSPVSSRRLLRRVGRQPAGSLGVGEDSSTGVSC